MAKFKTMESEQGTALIEGSVGLDPLSDQLIHVVDLTMRFNSDEGEEVFVTQKFTNIYRIEGELVRLISSMTDVVWVAGDDCEMISITMMEDEFD